MPHIHTGPGEYDLTASAFIIDISQPEPRLWLHRHKKLQVWLQFGGHVELAENPWQAVCHEVREESGFDMSQLRVLQPKARLRLSPPAMAMPQPAVLNEHPFGSNGPEGHRHVDIELAFVTEQPPAGGVSDGESAVLRLFTADEIKTLPDADIPHNVREVAAFVLGPILSEWEPVDCSEY